MTIDEAIKHAERVAEISGQTKCAYEHRQLADWLKTLRSLNAPGWILCYKEQPKKYDTNYLVTTDTHVIGIAKYYEDDAWVGVDANGDWLAEWDIIAWMPLPEPYDGGGA